MIEAIKQVLLKYTDPKPEYSGMFASDIAIKILNAVTPEIIKAIKE